MNMIVITVSGTPGTGKTWLSKRISQKFNLQYVNVTLLIRKHKIYSSYDKKRKCYVVDEKKLSKFLIKYINEDKYQKKYRTIDKKTILKDLKIYVRSLEEKKSEKLIANRKKDLFGVVIDSHLSHYLPKTFVDLCIITKTDLGILKKRLKKRKYSKGKIFENLQAEIFDTCYEEANKLGHKTIVYHN